MEKEIRIDKIFPLKNTSFYPGKAFCDMVYFCPFVSSEKRLWLLTEAKRPVMYIDHYQFEIRDISNHLTTRYRFCIDFHNLLPGVYRAKAFDQDTGKLFAISNPVEIMDSRIEMEQIFWGEIRSHTEMSDGIGEFIILKSHRKIKKSHAQVQFG
ncbi:MAG: hypothetical protein ACP5JO_02665 [Candidatus Ratteibacteria bacterium]